MRILRKVWVLPAVAALALSMVAAAASPAAASDSITWTNGNRNGNIKFIDNGPGQPGGGNNDDYFLIRDNWNDGHGVKAWVWLDGRLIGSKYNGRGFGKEVFWDPVQISGGHTIGMKVCLVDGTNDPSPSNCGTNNHFEID